MGLLLRARAKRARAPWVDIEKGDIVFDVGAYAGSFTLAVSERAKSVIAIEPDPRNYARLKQCEAVEERSHGEQGPLES